MTGEIEPFDPDAFSGEVPLFPLPNVVLVPFGFLPLHIFEPRYREMTRDALDGERLIGMALLKPGDPAAASAPVHSVVGLGRVIREAKLDDGRFNLILYGVARVRVVEEVCAVPYRTARVEVLEDRDAGGKGYERKRKILLGIYRQILTRVFKGSPADPPEDLPLGPLSDLLASVLSMDLTVKQQFLEEIDVAARCDRLLRLLEQGDASAPAPPTAVPPLPNDAWPPSVSSN